MAIVLNKGYSIHYSAAGENVSTTVIAQGFTWTGSTDAAHQLTFKNSAGDIVLGPFTAGIIGEPLVVIFKKPLRFKGLEVDVLGSGIVDVLLA